MTDDLSRYDLRHVTRATILQSLERLVGEPAATSAWESACEAVGMDPDAGHYAHHELLTIAMRLQARGGLVGIVGSSAWVNLLTNDALARRSSIQEEASDA